MTLADLHKALSDRAPGLGAFEEFIRDCERGMADQPDHAAFFGLLAAAAQHFRERHNQEPLSVTTIGAAREELLRLVDSARQAAAGEPAKQIEALNAIARADLG